MKRYLLFLLIVVPIVGILAFGLTRDPHVLPSPLTGKAAPDFNLISTDGKTVPLSSFRGHPLVLNFWATWCSACLAEHEAIGEARKYFGKDKVQFVGVVYQDKKENVLHHLKTYGTPFTVFFDPTSAAAIEYGVSGVPETFFIDSGGVIREKISGALTEDYLYDQITSLLQ